MGLKAFDIKHFLLLVGGVSNPDLPRYPLTRSITLTIDFLKTREIRDNPR